MKLTKGEINRLGERIRKTGNPSSQDLDLLQEFRKSYKEPLSRSFETLRSIAMKVDKNAIVTFRIKRIDTIIRKLSRYHHKVRKEEGTMPLSRMWDIAGCRCIFNSNDERLIFRLRDILCKEFGECKIYDHVTSPKKDGYKSLHIYVKDKKQNKRVEIQIRTTTQHNWATLVEIVDLIYNTKIKEGESNQSLKRFLFLFSKKESLNIEEQNELIKIERKYKVFKKMSKVFSKNYISIRGQWISQNRNNGSFYVIEAKKDLSSNIHLYNDFEEAEKEYYRKYTENSESNIVLTYIKNAKYKQISKAYSNYILTVHSFFDEYKKILEAQIIEQLKSKKFFKLWRSYNRYRKTNVIYLRNINNEIKELNKCARDKSIKRNHKKEWERDLLKEVADWKTTTQTFFFKQKKNIKAGGVFEFLVKMQTDLLRIQIK